MDPPGAADVEAQSDGKFKSKRTQIACLNCRKRKSRCLLDTDNFIPCLRCKRDGLDCVLGGSNRGGRRVRKKRPEEPQVAELPLITPAVPEEDTFDSIGNLGTWSRDAENPTQHQDADSGEGTHSDSLNADELPFSQLQNPSDALGILARVAGESTTNGNSNGSRYVASAGPGSSSGPHNSLPSGVSHPLLDQGVLTTQSLARLVNRYHHLYHPYYPIAPETTFDPLYLPILVAHEPHLLASMLLIASKDDVEEPHIHDSCAEHMKHLVSQLAAGGPADLEAIEALLLLAEWAPYTQRNSGKVGKGEEDKESWMHVGLALRIAYFLALDRYSFRSVEQIKDPDHQRKRLVWTATYISDRHVSIRVGRGFWSRGPGPLTTLRREDFQSLIPANPNREDYASIFQANLELTQIFSNVHDTLYSNPGSSFRTHMSGSYIKFIDDFRSAIYGWKSVWGTLNCSPNLKACLIISYDYLRLYTNAFAFQATVLRALPSANVSAVQSPKLRAQTEINAQAPQRVFAANNVGAVGDARFIYEGLDAAKAILTTVNSFVDPEGALRHMPLRYFLYVVYAGVFLYRARCTGVLGSDEDKSVRALIDEAVSRLQRSSVGATNGIQHPGSRYSQLLKLLWAKVPRKDKASRARFRHPGTHIASNPVDANGFSHPPLASPAQDSPHSVDTGESPAAIEQMGDFGWTNLGAVSDFAMHGNSITGDGAVDDAALWNGFLPLDMGWSAQYGFEGLGFDTIESGMLF